MSRPALNSPPVSDAAKAKMEKYHHEVVDQARAALGQHDVVVIGMGWNPNVPRARKYLDEAGIPHHDLDFGNYVTAWRPRLALKLWSGWPTFPQVFVKGTLIGGADDTKKALEDGSLKALLG